MVPFSKSNVCVCHSTASFMIHSLSFLSLSLSPAMCLWQDLFPSPICFLCALVFVLCASCCSNVEWGCWVFHICFRRTLLQSLVLFPVDKSSSATVKRWISIEQVASFIWGPRAKVLLSVLRRALNVFRLNESTLNEMGEWVYYQF